MDQSQEIYTCILAINILLGRSISPFTSRNTLKGLISCWYWLLFFRDILKIKIQSLWWTMSLVTLGSIKVKVKVILIIMTVYFFVLIKLMNWWNKGRLNNIKYYTLFHYGRNKLMLVVTRYLIGWNKKNLYNQISLLNWHQICINPLTVTFEFVQLDVQWFD